MMMKMSAVSSASPLYWLYALIRDTAKRRSLPDPFSPLAPSIVSASLAAESLTATPMRLLADRGLIRCRHRFLCLQKPGSDRTRSHKVCEGRTIPGPRDSRSGLPRSKNGKTGLRLSPGHTKPGAPEEFPDFVR